MVIVQPHYDPVNNPEHYASGGIECIDAMIAAYGIEVAMHFCQGNMFKYIWRFSKKNGEQDLQKANWYREKYIELKKRLVEENALTYTTVAHHVGGITATSTENAGDTWETKITSSKKDGGFYG